ncbi:MAG: protein kinase [Planctomycetota bacterium]
MPSGAEREPRPTPELQAGDILGGHYLVESLLGRGSSGAVYRARHTLVGEAVAVKVLHGAIAADAERRARFLREAQHLTSVVHRHAIQLRHVGEDAGRLFLIMSLARGKPLDRVLADEGPLPATRAATLLLQVLDALEEAHAVGVVHCDIKPGNLIVDTRPGPDGAPEDDVRVVDFGLSRVLPVEAQGEHRLAVAGTPAYMAPEQLRGADVDARADVFAAGAVLFEMLTGRPAFEGPDALTVARRILDGARPAWGAADDPAVPQALRDVVEEALAVSPDDRYQSTGQMSEAVRWAMSGLDTTAGFRLREAVATPRPHRRRPLLLAAASTALLLAVGGVSWMTRGATGTGSVGLPAWLQSLVAGEGDVSLRELDAALLQAPRDAELLLTRAQIRTARGEASALDDLDVLTSLVPGDTRIDCARAVWLARVRGDVQAARDVLGRALLTHRDDVGLRYARARLAWAALDTTAAERDVQRMQATAPHDVRTLIASALVLAARAMDKASHGDEAALHEAIAAATRAVESDPLHADAHAALATSLHTMGRSLRVRGAFAEARTYLDAAVRTAEQATRVAREAPDHVGQGYRLAEHFDQLAGAHFAAERPHDALAALDVAVAYAPRDVIVRGRRAFALQQLGQDERAIEEFDLLYDVTEAREPLFRLAFGHQQVGWKRALSGDLAGARVELERALQLYSHGLDQFPGAVELLTYRGEASVLRGLLDLDATERAVWLARGRSDLDAVLAKHPEEREARLRRAECALAEGDAERAWAESKRALEDRRDSPARYAVTTARAALALADVRAAGAAEALREARACLQWAAEGRPDSTAAILAIDACICMSAATYADPASAEAHLREADACVEARQTHAVEATPDGRAARDTLVDAALRAALAVARGNHAAARVLLRQAVDGRTAECAAGRWFMSPAWIRALGRLEGDRTRSEQADQHPELEPFTWGVLLPRP